MGYAPRPTLMPRQAVPIVAAVKGQATLADLIQRARHSQHWLQQVRAHLPEPMRAHVQAGPLDEDTWCLLVPNPAVAAKLRQLSPLLLNACHQRGARFGRIRIEVTKNRLA
jgi:hypothetical protein